MSKDWLTGKGKVVYDPFRGGMKNKIDWWCVIELDDSITDYYRWWANKYVNPLGYTDADKYDAKGNFTWHSLRDKREDLMLPSWGAHMSIVRGEKPREDLMHLWRKYHGQIVEFKYSPNVRFSGDTSGSSMDPDKQGVYWFIDAKCELGTHIRDELEKPSHWNFHITVGRVRQGQDFKYIPPVRKPL